MFLQQISIVVIHDNFLVRAGLTSTLAACDDIAVRTLDLGDAGILSFDLVVADLQSGLNVLGLASRMPPGTRRPRVAIVTESQQEWQIRRALAQGAAGYLLLGATADELLSAVRSVARGGCHLSQAVSARLAESLTVEPLTARQEDVLALLTDGLCNKRIATRLGITVGTVKTHLRQAFEKLHVRSRTEAIAAAGRRGILRQAGAQGDAQAMNAPVANDALRLVTRVVQERTDGLGPSSLRTANAVNDSVLTLWPNRAEAGGLSVS